MTDIVFCTFTVLVLFVWFRLAVWRMRYYTLLNKSRKDYSELMDHAITQSNLLSKYAAADALRKAVETRAAAEPKVPVSGDPDLPNWRELEIMLTRGAMDREQRARVAITSLMKSYGCSVDQIGEVLDEIDSD
jgi:hypothetical protein